MRKITPAQNRKIHALASRLGMDDDLLHEFVFMHTGKNHISGLSIHEAVKVIDSLEGKINYTAGNCMSERQKSYIFFLMKKIAWTDEAGEPEIKRLNGFVKKQYGIEHYQFMDRKTASNVIEFLKEMETRKKQEEQKNMVPESN